VLAEDSASANICRTAAGSTLEPGAKWSPAGALLAEGVAPVEECDDAEPPPQALVSASATAAIPIEAVRRVRGDMGLSLDGGIGGAGRQPRRRKNER
jgi:hypothetical protein